jgi:hypothetical protein
MSAGSDYVSELWPPTGLLFVLQMMYEYGETRRLGGVMVSVFTIGLKVSGFKLGRGGGCFRARLIRSMLCLGGEVKPSAPCR